MRLDSKIVVPNFARLDEYAGAWMIELSRGQYLANWASRQDWHTHVAQAKPMAARSSLETIATGGQDKTIAVVRLSGLLMKQVSSASEGTSTIQARRDLRAAVNDPNVTGLLMVIDSPGGTAAGTMDLADEVRAASKRKPVWAFVEDLCCSAAYFVASQCEKVIANNRMAWVGSIGTMMCLYDVSRAANDAGVECVVFATGEHKATGAPGAPITEAQRTKLQTNIDQMQSSFDAAVRKGRSLSQKQLEAVRTGEVWGADQAIDLGLVDAIQSFEVTVSQLTKQSSRPEKSASAVQPGGKAMNFTQWLLSQNIVEAELSTVTRAALQKAFDAEQRPSLTRLLGRDEQEGDNPSPIIAMRKASADETRRISAIQTAGAKYSVKSDKIIQAIETGADPREFELEALRASHAGNKVAPISGNILGGSCEAAASLLECAVLMTGKLDEKRLLRDYGEQTMEQSSKHFRGGISLQGLVMFAARANGYTGPESTLNAGNVGEILQYAFVPSMGVSNISMPTVFSNIANKFLAEGYNETNEQWRIFAKIGNLNNFKETTTVRPILGDGFEEVGPDGQIKHARLAEETYGNKAKSFAMMLAITRVDYINDDIGALTTAPTEIGRKGKKKVDKDVWTEFMDNSAFFTTTAVTTVDAMLNPNKATGAGSALGAPGLTLAKTLFRKQIQPNGDSLDLMPFALVVPAELADPARVLLSSREVRDTTANKVSTTENPHFNSPLQIVDSPFLSNTAYTGNSAAQWYLTASPNSGVACIEVGFLNGQETPTIQQSDMVFNTLGSQMRAFIDYGVRKQNKRGAVQMVGA